MIEWLAFAVLAVVGYGILARKEAQTIRLAQGSEDAPRTALDKAG